MADLCFGVDLRCHLQKRKDTPSNPSSSAAYLFSFLSSSLSLTPITRMSEARIIFSFAGSSIINLLDSS